MACQLNDSENVWAIIRENIKEAALNTSIHGIGSIFRSNLILIKISWLLLFLGSSGYCSYTIVLDIKSYLDFEVITNIYTDLDIPVQFPKVTICNQNPIMTEFGLNFSEKILKPILEPGKRLTYLEAINRRFTVLVNSKAQLGADAEKIGLTLDDMLISCDFLDASCNLSDFVYSFNSFYGNCYSFNNGYYPDGTSREIAQVTKTGSLDGFYLELYVGYPTSPYSVSLSSGVHIFIDNQTVFNSIYDGFSISQSAHTSILVSTTFTENLPNPYSECTSDEDIQNSKSELVQMILSTDFQYRYIDCLNMCFGQYLVDNCSCQDGSFVKPFTNVPFCSNFTEITCSLKAYSTFYSTMNVKSYCADRCPLECDSVDYAFTISSTAYPTYSHYLDLIESPVIQKNFKYNKSAMTFDTVKNSVVSLFVNYGDFSYTRIQKDPKITLLDLIGQIGGVAGLFIGASFMSFFEVVDLGIVLLTFLVQHIFSVIHWPKGRIVNQAERGQSS